MKKTCEQLINSVANQLGGWEATDLERLRTVLRKTEQREADWFNEPNNVATQLREIMQAKGEVRELRERAKHKSWVC